MPNDRHAAPSPDQGFNRRIFVGGAAALAGLASLPLSARSLAGSGVKDVVLIHGAWHGGWCWDPVRRLLEAEGLRVHTPTLPGLGERAAELNPSLGLADQIADVRGYIEEQGLSNFVLVGHSFGGMIITGLADAMKERIAHIIYLDAALPKDGQSMITYGAPRPPEVLAATEAAIRGLAPDNVAMPAFPPSLLGIPVDHELHDWVAERLTPHPLKTWLDPIALENGGSDGLPRTYVLCTDPILPQTQFPSVAEQARADPSWHSTQLATGHDAMITAPQGVAQIIQRAIVMAERTGPSA